MQTSIDHFMYAVPDLEQGVAWAARTFDAVPVYGGEHIGLGTRAAFLSLGATYLEIIAPDPGQTLRKNFGGQLSKLQQGGLVTWIARGDLLPIANILQVFDISTAGPSRTQRRLDNDALLEWDLLFARGHGFGSRLPFFIDWLQSPHPATQNPLGGRFDTITLTTPEPQLLRKILGALNLDIRVTRGTPGIQLTVICARGEVLLTSTAQTARLSL